MMQKSQWSVRMPLIVGLLALGTLVGGFGYWSVASTLAGAIVASGQVEVDQNRQVVQHPDGGVVASIKVDEGDMVAAGDVLIQLDPTLLQSNLNVTESQLFEIMARQARLKAERDDSPVMEPAPALAQAAVDNAQVQDLIDGQQRLFDARRESVAR